MKKFIIERHDMEVHRTRSCHPAPGHALTKTEAMWAAAEGWSGLSIDPVVMVMATYTDRESAVKDLAGRRCEICERRGHGGCWYWECCTYWLSVEDGDGEVEWLEMADWAEESEED